MGLGKKLLKAGVGLAGFVGVSALAILAMKNNDDSYPTCKSCGSKMTEFDGCAWFTCPSCGNSVRIIDGSETWHDEIFNKGTNSHKSDFELADFCHGGDLTED